MAVQKMRKLILMSVGTLSLGTGLVGIFVPLLPTTCFILLAAYCYSKSSDRFYQKLISHSKFGPTILQWEKYRVIRVPIKCWASTMISISALLLWTTSAPLYVKIGTSAFLMGLVVYIWSKPSQIPSGCKLAQSPKK